MATRHAEAPPHRERSPISFTTISNPMVQQQERLSVLPMICAGVLREERSARVDEFERHAQ